jgi:hypothetical protein
VSGKGVTLRGAPTHEVLRRSWGPARLAFMRLSTVFTLAFLGCAPSITPQDAGAGDAGTTLPDAGAAQGDAGINAGNSLIQGGHDVLFVGNSYIYVNDVPGRYRALADVTGPPPVRLESVVTGGYRLTQHAADANTDGTPLARWLRTGTPADTAFDVVVLQEQSQIGGFPENNPDRVASLAGASELAALARARNAAVVLYLTWGREHGDDTNPGLFADFPAMQDRLDVGYQAMATQLRAEGTVVRVAPVGPAFRVVFDQVTAAGADPTAEGSAFDALYDADGSHPSSRGAYLAATVIFCTITGANPRALPDGNDLDGPTSTALRDAAGMVLEDPAWSPWLR